MNELPELPEVPIPLAPWPAILGGMGGFFSAMLPLLLPGLVAAILPRRAQHPPVSQLALQRGLAAAGVRFARADWIAPGVDVTVAEESIRERAIWHRFDQDPRVKRIGQLALQHRRLSRHLARFAGEQAKLRAKLAGAAARAYEAALARKTPWGESAP